MLHVPKEGDEVRNQRSNALNRHVLKLSQNDLDLLRVALKNLIKLLLILNLTTGDAVDLFFASTKGFLRSPISRGLIRQRVHKLDETVVLLTTCNISCDHLLRGLITKLSGLGVTLKRLRQLFKLIAGRHRLPARRFEVDPHFLECALGRSGRRSNSRKDRLQRVTSNGSVTGSGNESSNKCSKIASSKASNSRSGTSSNERRNQTLHSNSSLVLNKVKVTKRLLQIFRR